MTDGFDLLDNEPIARKSLTIFYLIDTSGSMSGEKIGTVNTVMEEVIPEIRNIGGSDSDIKMTVLTFDSDCKWIYDEPVSVEEISWKRLSAYGWTEMGEAFGMLNGKLSRSGFMNSPALSFAPIIFLLSDGYPAEGYQENLNKLKSNKWFKYGLKVAVAIGEDADKNVLAEFTGNPETVVTANNGKALARLIREITVTSSQIGSKSSTFSGDELITSEIAEQAKQDELVQGIKNCVKPEDIDFDDGW